MSKKIFISYKHENKEWVRRNLVPCLEAGGAEVIIDYKYFMAGQSVIGLMDQQQEQADISVLVLSPAYFQSPYCVHEMHKALAKDPQFENGKVIFMFRESCTFPLLFSNNPPLWVDLTDDGNADQWDLLLNACQVDLGCTAPAWLKTHTELVRHLSRRESINLVIKNDPKWRELLKHTQAELKNNHGIQLGLLDMEAGTSTTVTGFITQMIQACGGNISNLTSINALKKMDEYFARLPSPAFLVLYHFDIIIKEKYYDIRFFGALRHLIMEKQKLVLLIESRAHFHQLVPSDHLLSKLNLLNIELGGHL